MKSWGTRSQDSLPDGSALNENHWRHEMIDKIASRPLCLLKRWLADQEESVPSTERALSRSEIKGILTFPANTQRVVLSRGENCVCYAVHCCLNCPKSGRNGQPPQPHLSFARPK